LIRTFIDVLGIEEPGTLLCILVEEKIGQMKKVVDAITEEKISFGSILVARHWEEAKRVIFPYLLTLDVSKVKKNSRRWAIHCLIQWTGYKQLSEND
jgi:acetoin utilization protein AcuB